VLDQIYRNDFAFLQAKDPRIVFADPGKYVYVSYVSFSELFVRAPFCRFAAGLPLFTSTQSPLVYSLPPSPGTMYA
jgi:hypothetical protein